MTNPTAQVFHLSAQQRWIWLQQEGGGPHLVQCSVSIDGDVRPDILREALETVVSRHEVLRTTFVTHAGIRLPFQVVAAQGSPLWVEPVVARPSEVDDLLHWHRSLPFDLQKDMPLRVSLVPQSERRHLLLMTLPALCADGVSLRNLVSEVAQAYEAHLTGSATLESEVIQYVDFAQWHDELLQEDDEDRQEGIAYWGGFDLSRLGTFELPGQARTADLDGEALQAHSIVLPPDVEARLEETARMHETTISVVLLAALQVLLWRLSSSRDILVGNLYQGREGEDLEGAQGLFACLLPVPGLFAEDLSFGELLGRVHAIEERGREAQWYALVGEERSASMAAAEFPAAFEFTDWSTEPSTAHLSFSLQRQILNLGAARLKLCCVRARRGLLAEIQADPRVFPAHQGTLWAERYAALLTSALAEPRNAIGNLDILSGRERQRLLIELRGDSSPADTDRLFHCRFEEVAREAPERIAIQLEDRRITYAALNERANRLAHSLRHLGVRPEERVGLFFERTEEWPIGLLGVLKAGGAYVPLEPVFPTARLSVMLGDAGVRVVVTVRSLLERLPSDSLTTLCLDDESAGWSRFSADNPEPWACAGNLAYVLFTSGSTGRPKAVAVEHRHIVSYMEGVIAQLSLPVHARYATLSTFAADLGNTMVFPPLASGGSLHILTAERASDPAALAEYCRCQAIDCLKIVPSHLAALLTSSEAADILPRQRLVLGGEAASWQLIHQVWTLAPRLEVFNHYGPTETTVGALTCRLEPLKQDASPGPPLGRPLPRVSAYLVDSRLQPVVDGASGELLLGGCSVSRGYLARPDATAERFVPDPFGEQPGQRLYRTGDLARLRPNGDLEFLGRIDSQVKIRGFRIELGEVEAVLAQHPEVWTAAVMAREDGGGERRLVAYVVARVGCRPSPDALRPFLRERLPDYMVPPTIVLLDALPLTPNGKLDRAALPAPEKVSFFPRDMGSVPPRTPAEESLAAIWCEVLGLPQIGVHDNFFDLGGDSILAIQVISKANRLGFRFTPKQLFRHQTVAALVAEVGEAVEAMGSQPPMTGLFPLVPIQHWFFERCFTRADHWNQSMLLETPPDLPPAMWERAAQRIVEHHEAFRLRFEKTAAGWRQRVEDAEDRGEVVWVDLSEVAATGLREVIEAVAAQIQESLSLTRGPLVRFAILEMGDGQWGRLLMVAHHLVIDAVSWQILLQDLESVAASEARGERITLPAATTSTYRWAERLEAHVRSGALAGELAYWSAAIPARWPSLPRDGEDGSNTYASERTVLVSLEAADTEALLREVPPVYRTQINDILVTALARGCARWTGQPALLVEMEGHGREELVEGVDLSRTIGWFTTHFPLLVDAGAKGPGEALKRTKEQLRRLPHRGIGFGLLRYLDGDGAGSLSSLAEPEVKLNYLGQLDRSRPGAGVLRPAVESCGADRSPFGERSRLLVVDAGIVGGRLHMRWTYSGDLHRQETVEAVAGHVLDELRLLIAHCLSPEAGGCTVSDFPLAHLDQSQLDALIAAAVPHLAASDPPGRQGHRLIEDIYPLSPLQQSLLVHALAGGGAGFEQKSAALRGEVDLAAFARTWQELIDRHPMLRTAFLGHGLNEPHQVVYRRSDIPIDVQDWRDLEGDEQQVRLDLYLRADRERGFDPARPSLMRIALLRLADDTWQLVWSYHHLIVDAWCRTLVLREVFFIYNALARGHAWSLPPARPFRTYIEWLQRQDVQRAADFWRDLLRGALVTSPWIDAPAEGGDGDGCVGTFLTAGDAELVRSFTRRNKITPSSLWHGAWALLLGRWSGADDVLFGTTVSGRPAELEGIESIVGMFINNLPVRVSWSPAVEVRAWLAELQELLVTLREVEWTSPAQIQEWTGRPAARRLFESLVIFQNYPADEAVDRESSDQLRIVSVDSRLRTNYPLTVVASPGEPFGVSIYYDARRFDAAAMQRMLHQLAAVLVAMAGEPERLLSSVPLLGTNERRQLETDQAHRKTDARPETLPRRVETWAQRSQPPVIRCGEELITYRELDLRAQKLADRLAARGIGPGQVVGVAVERSPSLPVALLGVLAAGAAFVIVDPALAEDAKATLLARADASLLIDESFVAAEKGSGPFSRPPVDIGDIACILFGATPFHGEPIGAVWTHRTLSRHADAMADLLSLAVGDVFVADASGFTERLAIELLGALVLGVEIVFPSLRKAGVLISEGAKGTLAPLSPNEWSQLLDAGWRGTPDLRIQVTGAPLARGLAHELIERSGSLVNLYGAREVGGWVSGGETGAVGGRITAGRPSAGVAVHLLSRDLQLVPIGVPGAIFVGGEALAVGYQGRPDLTAVAFVPDPWSPDPGGRMFATGDLGRFTADGRLELHGQLEAERHSGGLDLDRMVLEQELRDEPAVRDAAVRRWRDTAGEESLVAYVVLAPRSPRTIGQLRASLGERLPRRILPSFFVELDRLPHRADGRLDLEQLPPPDQAGRQLFTPYVPPCDELELRLRQMWENLFQIRPIGIRDDFFALGGHSLLAVLLMSEIRREFACDVPLATLLQAKTIEQLGAVLRQGARSPAWSPLATIQRGSSRPPVFCVHPIGGESLCYVELARFLGLDQPVYGLQSRAWLEDDRAEEPLTIEEMASDYLRAVRQVQPHGPYSLVGWSFGGLVALEMAQQLQVSGELVGLLAPLDSMALPQREANPGAAVEYLYEILGRPGSLSLEDMRELCDIDSVLAYVEERLDVVALVPGLDLQMIRRYWRAEVSHRRASVAYRVRPYSGPIDLFLADEGHRTHCPDPYLGWLDVATGGLTLHRVPGTHGSLVSPPHVQNLAQQLRAVLDGRTEKS